MAGIDGDVIGIPVHSEDKQDDGSNQAAIGNIKTKQGICTLTT